MIRYLLIVLGITGTLIGCASGSIGGNSTVTVGTFNMEWLGDGYADKKPRTDADYLRIADIIIKINADVLAVQEIENNAALQKVLRYAPEYSGFVAETEAPQNVGVLYKKSMVVTQKQVYQQLAVIPGRLRPGLLVECKKGNFDWLMMVVHLKSSSRADSTQELREQARAIRTQQCTMLSNFVDSVIAQGAEKDVMIVGDLNDFPGRIQNATLTPILENNNLFIPTAKMKSCSNPNWTTIDHIVLTKSAKPRYIEGSERMEDFKQFLDKADAEKVSDHCPVLLMMLCE